MGFLKRNRRGTKNAAARRRAASFSVSVVKTTEKKAETADNKPEAETDGKKLVEAATEPVEAVTAPVEETASAVKTAVKADASSVFRFFREISAIPHGSHHTDQISEYLAGFAEERGLRYVKDETNNVIIFKEASEGYEDAEPIALQGHIDMVLACEPDKDIDLITEPITIIEEGDWMRADGTTLGADNGVAVAIMLALLDDRTIAHPYLECVFTSDEEVGLIGASSIDLSVLRSRRMLNLDSEDEGMFCAGCAGGADVVCRMPVKLKSRSGKIVRIKVSGLRGGHSGSDIHLGSANGIVLLSRMLYRLFRDYPFHLVSIGGGDANNAIPTNAEAVILFPRETVQEEIETVYQAAAEDMEQEYRSTDSGMKWDVVWEEGNNVKAASGKNTGNLLGYLMSAPNGVTQMSPVLKDMPRTSLNMGVLRTENEEVRVEFMVRSSVNSQTAYLCDRLICLTKGFGGKAKVRSSYPAWEYSEVSPLRELAVRTYKELTGEEPSVKVIHAGLECGILAGKLKGLDCISAGPDLENIHTTKERMSIPSVENLWGFVLELLKEAGRQEIVSE